MNNDLILTEEELEVIRTLRTMKYGTLTIHKLNNKVHRVELSASILIDHASEQAEKIITNLSNYKNGKEV